MAEAAERGDTTVRADAAVDVWALGIVAFELLTRSRVFAPFEAPAGAIMDALAGRRELPWEGPQRGELLRELRGLRRSVLACLDRDAARRPSSAAVLGSWHGLFERHTGGTRAEFAEARGERGDGAA